MLVRRNSNWLPDVFNDLFNTEFMPRVNTTKPAVNVIEKDHEYTVELAAPGMTRDDFTVTLDEDENLVVAMEKKVEKTENENENEKKSDGHYLRREFFYSKFNQTLLLPEDVDRDKIVASVENGVLTVTLPKKSAEDLKKERKIITVS